MWRRMMWLAGLLVLGAEGALSAAPAERYGPVFYGIELPEEGARVLLVVDTSKSMGRRDGARSDGGTRWETLCEEVGRLAEGMAEGTARRRSPYGVAFLFEGGEGAHGGTALYDMGEAGARERLLEALRGRGLTSGGAFEETFGEKLWPLVARHGITHVIYLGDNDIGRHREAVESAVGAWYALPAERPQPEQRELWRQKAAWRKQWAGWRRVKPGQPVLRQKGLGLPPPPKEVVFSCVAIGQASPCLQALAERGGGVYVERLGRARKGAKGRGKGN